MSATWVLLLGLCAGDASMARRSLCPPGPAGDVEALLAAPPADLAPHLAFAQQQGQAGRDQQQRQATVDELRAVVCADAEPPSAVDADSLRQEIADIRRDPRFFGARAQKDALARFWDEAIAWFMGLLESDAMQRYAGISRAIYLIIVLLGGGLVIGRALRRRRRAMHAEPDTQQVERRRRQQSADLRGQAEQALGAGAPRRAFALGDLALLARVSDVDRVAVRSADTHREVLAKLSPARAALVAPGFAQYARGVFATAPTLEGARAFLATVDEILAALDAGGAG